MTRPSTSDEPAAEAAIEDTPSRVTIYEVARRAGVSIATVSHALNRPERVSSSTRERVLDAVDALGFTPKQTAVSLARSGVGRIAVVAPFGRYPSYFTRLLGVLRACESQRIEVVVFDDVSRDEPSVLLETLPTTGRVDGIIVMGIEPDPSVTKRLRRRHMPTVLLDRASSDFTHVTVDDEAGGRMLAEHMIAQGARSFAFVSPAPPDVEHVTSGELRARGFRGVVRDAGLTDVTWLIAKDSVDGGREAATDVVAMPALPDAIFAVHDRLAAGLLGGLRDVGVRVPGDVMLAGYDDTDVAAAMSVTTVRQPFEASGHAAAQALLELLAEPDAPVRQISLRPELVVRTTA
jgi:LacI family transcriptional regulator